MTLSEWITSENAAQWLTDVQDKLVALANALIRHAGLESTILEITASSCNMHLYTLHSGSRGMDVPGRQST